MVERLFRVNEDLLITRIRIASNDVLGLLDDFLGEGQPKWRRGYKIIDQVLFFIIVMTLIVGGIISLIKGVKGKWDNEVKSEEMVGPGGDKNIKKD